MPRRFPDGRPAAVPAILMQIERRLSAPGEILVRAGNRVEPDDLIGQCSIQHDPALLDVASALDVAPAEMRRHLRRKVGDRVTFRDLLARRRGRNVLAPFKGTLTDVNDVTGFITLTPAPIPASVPAAIRGYIVGTEEGNAATIETAAAIIQGVVGFGSERWGTLRVLTTDPAAPLTAEMIDARNAFTIVVGGAGISADALRKAQREQVKGLIVGSIDAAELRAYWGPHYERRWSELLRTGGLTPGYDDAPSLLVTEGFGQRAMSQPIFDLLTQFDRQEAYLDPTTHLGLPERRPRLLLPLPRLPNDVVTVASAAASPVSGDFVRLLDEAHLGQIGRVESLHPSGRLPSGVRTATATVRLNGERVVLPESALEVIN